MWQPPAERDRVEVSPTLYTTCCAAMDILFRCLCCLGTDLSQHNGEGGQRLLSTQGEAHLAIEAAGASPPRLPLSIGGGAGAGASSDGPLLKGHGPSSSSSLPSASPPMPQPFFPPPPRPKQPGGSGGSGGPEGGSPKAGGGKLKGGSRLNLLEEDDDVCPTCLDPYTEDNPKVLTRCGHAFHLPCLYEWLERSETCPVCERPMQFEEVV